MVWGVLAFTLLRVLTGRAKEVSGAMYLMSALFLVWLIFG
jgi:xanthine/uracil/vitamin C permease (AzgA family)